MSRERILLVQTSHIVQLLYVAERLFRREGPGTVVDVWLSRTAADNLPEDHPFGTVYLSRPPAGEMARYSRIVAPLVSRRYLVAKLRLALIGPPVLGCGYECDARPLTLRSVLRDLLRRPHLPVEFPSFATSFPLRRLQGRVLWLEPAQPSLETATRSGWKRAISDTAQITRVSAGKALGSWRSLRRQSFDGAVLFFPSLTGPGIAPLLLLMLRVSRVVVVDELGSCSTCSRRGLIGLLVGKVLARNPKAPVVLKILFIQTESPRYIVEAVKRLKARIHPGAEVTIVCRSEDEGLLAQSLPECDLITVDRDRRSAWHVWRTCRRLRADVQIAVFSRRSVFLSYKLLFFLTNLRRKAAFNATLEFYRLNLRTLHRIFRNEPLLFEPERPPKRSLVLVQTDDPDRTLEVFQKVRDMQGLKSAEVSLVCRLRDRDKFLQEAFNELICIERRRLLPRLRVLREIRARRPELVIGSLSGRPGFSFEKSILFLAAVRHRLIFNSRLDCFYLRPGNLNLLWARDLQEDSVLLVQTEHEEKMLRCLDQLESAFSHWPRELVVFCREDKREHFERHPRVTDVVTYQPGQLRRNLARLRRLRRERFDVSVALFSGRPIFRLQKLFFVSSGSRRKLAFNAELECFYLKPRTWKYLLRNDFQPHSPLADEQNVLFIQTEDDPTCVSTIRQLEDPQVAKVGRIIVYCREDKKAVFESCGRVDQIITYRSLSLRRALRHLRDIRRLKCDTVCAIFSGRPIYRAQKLLFFLTGARNKLVFNENEDCFYLRRDTLRHLFRRPDTHLPNPGVALRPCLKGLLFLPRFAYLLVWASIMKIRRARALNSG